MTLIAPNVFWQSLDNDGNPLDSGKIYTYEAGTTTNKATYTDSTGVTANANPIILDANGRADIWLDEGAYKFVITDSTDTTIETVDNITGDAANVFGNSVQDKGISYSVVAGDQNSIINATATLTLSLLDTATAGQGFVVGVKNSSASGTVTIDPDGLELIDGASSLDLEAGQSALLVVTGSGWLSMFQDFLSLGSDNVWTGDNDFSSTVGFDGKVKFGDDGEAEISSGAIVISGANHTVDTESDAASDDLETITTTASGLFVFLRAASATRTIVIKHNVGNIFVPSGVDITLNDTNRHVGLLYDNDLSRWTVVFDGTVQEDAANAAAILQVTSIEITATSDTTTIPEDGTSPTVSEGTEIASQSITPASTSSDVKLTVAVPMENNGGRTNIIAAFRGSVCIGVATHADNVSGQGSTLSLNLIDSPATVSPTTYSIRAGISASGTWNAGRTASATFGGEPAKNRMILEEIG